MKPRQTIVMEARLSSEVPRWVYHGDTVMSEALAVRVPVAHHSQPGASYLIKVIPSWTLFSAAFCYHFSPGSSLSVPISFYRTFVLSTPTKNSFLAPHTILNHSCGVNYYLLSDVCQVHISSPYHLALGRHTIKAHYIYLLKMNEWIWWGEGKPTACQYYCRCWRRFLLH